MKFRLVVASLILLFAPLVVSAFDLSGYGLTEGEVIGVGTPQDPDIFIVNDYGYKRLFINPEIFLMYGHLGGFASVRRISSVTRDAFPVSPFFRNCEINDQHVYVLEVTGQDSGILHWINMPGDTLVESDPYFFQKVFCINSREFSWYAQGTTYVDVDSINEHLAQPLPRPPGLSVDIKINGTDMSSTVSWGSEINSSWISAGATRCEGFDYIDRKDTAINIRNIPLSGSISLYARSSLPLNTKSIIVYVMCYDRNNNYAYDFVSLNISEGSQPSISITSPASGVSVVRGSQVNIAWASKNISGKINISVSPKGDTTGKVWYLAKDIENTGSYSWNTNMSVVPSEKWGTVGTTLGGGDYTLFISDSSETIYSNTGILFSIN